MQPLVSQQGFSREHKYHESEENIIRNLGLTLLNTLTFPLLFRTRRRDFRREGLKGTENLSAPQFPAE
jgi:hypothetical protein